MSEAAVIERIDDRYANQGKSGLLQKLAASGIPVNDEGICADGVRFLGRTFWLSIKPSSPSHDHRTIMGTVKSVEYHPVGDELRIYVEGVSHEYLTPSTLNRGRWFLGKGVTVCRSYDAVLTF